MPRNPNSTRKPRKKSLKQNDEILVALTGKKRGRKGKPKPFKCEICTCTFKQENTYKLHLLSHQYKTFSCETCLVEFPTLGSLQKHSLVEHPHKEDIQPLIKPSPKKKAEPKKKKTKKELMKEAARIPDPNQPTESNVDVETVRNRCLRFVSHKVFVCKHCGKFLSKENSHRIHEMSHDFSQPLVKRRPSYIKRIDTPADDGSSQSDMQWVESLTAGSSQGDYEAEEGGIIKQENN